MAVRVLRMHIHMLHMHLLQNVRESTVDVLAFAPCVSRVMTDQICLQKLNERGGRSKAADWKSRMGKRILDADSEHARKRGRHA